MPHPGTPERSKPARDRAISNDGVGRPLGAAGKVAPGGSAEQAAAARGGWKTSRRATECGQSLARGSSTRPHGSPSSAPRLVRRSLEAAAAREAQAPLVAGSPPGDCSRLRGSVADLYAKHRAPSTRCSLDPGIWVARGSGARGVARPRSLRQGGKARGGYDAEVRARVGCVRGRTDRGTVRPRGRAGQIALFHAEKPALGPSRGRRTRCAGAPPRFGVSRPGAWPVADEQVQEGVFYAQSFFTTQGDRELSSPFRGPSQFGSTTRVCSRATPRNGARGSGSAPTSRWRRSASGFGSRARARGERTATQSGRNGGPCPVRRRRSRATLFRGTAADPRRPEPSRCVCRAAARGAAALGPLDAMLAADAAHAEQMDDVASVLMEPLVAPRDAAALSLQLAASFTAGDPALPEDARAPRARALRNRALGRDSRLWRARLMAILDDEEQHGLPDAVEPLRTLAGEVESEPEILERLAQLLRPLGMAGRSASNASRLVSPIPGRCVRTSCIPRGTRGGRTGRQSRRSGRPHQEARRGLGG